jgi:hypothetical protein
MSLTMEDKIEVIVNAVEMNFLRKADFLSADQKQSLLSAISRADDASILRVSPEVALTFGETLTLQLARTGFDKNYNLNVDGKLLDVLIDKFSLALSSNHHSDQ